MVSKRTEHITKGAGNKMRGVGEGSTTTVNRTAGDLWKGEGWCRVHGVNTMNMTGTFRKESREFEGGGFGVD